jgi:imidazolonepropionase-like amidohydrolase
MADVSSSVAGSSLTTFTDAEVKAMITEAHRFGVKIVAHASEAATLRRLTAHAHLHVDSIEHGYDMLPLLDGLEPGGAIFASGAKPVFWVPTLATYDAVGRPSGAWARAAQSFRAFLAKRPRDVRIACGGDTGVFAHGENAREMQAMVRLGAGWREVLQWCTLGGWECVRSMRWEGEEGKARLAKVEELREEAGVVGDNEVAFGAVRKGFAADIVATTGNLAGDFENAVHRKSISFVMKGGKVFKRDGKEINY